MQFDRVAFPAQPVKDPIRLDNKIMQFSRKLLEVHGLLRLGQFEQLVLGFLDPERF